MDKFKIERVASIEEKIAYRNLENYDNKKYTPSPPILSKKSLKYSDFSTLQELNIDEEDLINYIEYGRVVNSKHSSFKPGTFHEKNSYEATFSKKYYYSSELEFIVELFISHHRVHAFMDGNKRTALNYLFDLLYKFTKYKISNVIRIQDAQIHYLTNRITEGEFIQIILNEVEEQLVKMNDKCQLEHLIPRIEIEENNEDVSFSPSERKASFTLSDLEQGAFFYDQLRKPYFQRDTNQWSVAKIERLLETFLDDGLIPAVIMWETNNGEILIIDGAHRVSSLIAWVNDDYGKLDLNTVNSHHALSDYFNEKIGSYQNIKISKDEKYKKIKSIIAKKSIPIQWVTGDYENVKESFIRINEQGVALSNDEKELIENDQLPTSKLARAILSHGSGQKSQFANKNSEAIYKYFFLPTFLKNNKIYPMLGGADEEFVISKVFNVVKIVDNGFSQDTNQLEEKILKFCEFSQDYLQISNKAYFYGSNHRFKTSSLFGFTLFIKRMMEDKKLLSMYLNNRKEFEEFITDNEKYVQLISRRRRQSSKAYTDVAKYYEVVLKAVSDSNEQAIFDEFSYIPKVETKSTKRQKEIAEKYKEFIEAIPRCVVCGGFKDGYSDVETKHNCCLER